MRWIAAPYIFPCNRPPVKNGILKCTDEGVIAEIIENEKIEEKANLEYYNGLLVPGFVNTHCHLELSHLFNRTNCGEGIGNFIGNVNKFRSENPEIIQSGIINADRLMWMNGISVVGDISNSADTLEVKQNSKIHYHTFVEAFGFLEVRAQKAFGIAQKVRDSFHSIGLIADIVPHAPYSVSMALMEKICYNAQESKSVLSIHNQESEGENQFFKDKTGPIADHLQKNIGINISDWKPFYNNPLQFIIEAVDDENSLLLVHNTFTSKQNIELIRKKRNKGQTYFVLCPNSNLFIEKTLPPVRLFKDEKLTICIGTDSLASNHNLSVLDELKTIQSHFPELGLDELFRWSCLNGANALKAGLKYGSFEPGKNPGVNLITGVDLHNFRLTEKSKIKRLI